MDACRRSPTTRCARAATTPRPASRTWTSTASRRRSASRASRASAARPSPRPRTRSWAWPASRRTTTGWWRSGAATRGGRLIPLIIVPLWDAELAAAEVRRNAARGVHAVCFSEIPPHLGLPSIHSGFWDPFFAACAETEHHDQHAHRLVVAHAGHLGRRAGGGGRHAELQQRHGVAHATGSSAASSSSSPTSRSRTAKARSAGCPTSSSAPTTCGASTGPGAASRTSSPSRRRTYYYRNVYGCFFRDRHGLESLDEVGVDNVTFETDYPHTDSTWPDTKQSPRSCSTGSTTTRSTRSCGATPSRCSTSTWTTEPARSPAPEADFASSMNACTPSWKSSVCEANS